jgi:hypothetical protein
MKKTLLFLAAAAAACAQSNSFQQNGWVRFNDWTAVRHPSDPMIAQTGPVLGKPFSGTEIRQSLQVLSDGTVVKHSDTTTFYRDSQGRMRSESPEQAMIYDPVSSYTITLNPKQKTYQKNPVMASATVSIAVVGDRTSVSSHTGMTRPQGASEELTPQLVNGVLAKGSRITTTIPAGTFGNDRDVKIVNERWYSDELQLLLKSSNNDPRYGTTTYELTNILQAPPDPALFQIPADYAEGRR